MISFQTSMELLKALECPTLGYEKVYLDDALGRILAMDIIAEEDYPRYPMAAMDGYAIQHQDLTHGRIAITGDNPAGHHDTLTVVAGSCIKTFTGAVMPEGADTLIPIENVAVDKEHILIQEMVPLGFSVRPQGESYHQGDTLIPKGTKVGFAEIGVLAGLNRVHVPVMIRPKVAVLSTGSEILDLGESQTHTSQIRSSNNYTIATLAKMAGAEVRQLGTFKDHKEEITQAFHHALATSDLVISTGGVSVGDYDFVKDIIPELGAEVIYKGVKIKPGQHLLLARRGDIFILALPGFAYSSTVTAILYAIPLIRRLLDQGASLPIVTATLKEPFKKRSKKREFTACNLSFENGHYVVDFKGKRTGSSAILNNLLGHSALMITTEENGNLDIGASVHVIPLDQW